MEVIGEMSCFASAFNNLDTSIYQDNLSLWTYATYKDFVAFTVPPSTIVVKKYAENLIVQSGVPPVKFSDFVVLKARLAVVKSVAFCPNVFDNKSCHSNRLTQPLLLAVGLSNARIRLWEIPTGKLVLELMDGDHLTVSLSFFSDSRRRHLLSASTDKTLKVWDLNDNGNMFSTLKGHSKSLLSCCYSPNGRFAASSAVGSQIFLWDMSTFKFKHQLVGQKENVDKCIFTPDSSMLITASSEGCDILLWDVYSCAIVRAFRAEVQMGEMATYFNGIRDVAVSSNGLFIAAITANTILNVWSTDQSDEPIDTVKLRNTSSLSNCFFSTSERTVFVRDIAGDTISLIRPKSIVPSLMQLSRCSFKQFQPDSNKIKKFGLPKCIKEFLLFECKKIAESENKYYQKGDKQVNSPFGIMNA